MKKNRVGKLECAILDNKKVFVFQQYERNLETEPFKFELENVNLIGTYEADSFEEIFGCKEGEVYDYVKKYIKEGIDLYTYFENEKVVSKLTFIDQDLAFAFGKTIEESVFNLDFYIKENEDDFSMKFAKTILAYNFAQNLAENQQEQEYTMTVIDDGFSME